MTKRLPATTHVCIGLAVNQFLGDAVQPSHNSPNHYRRLWRPSRQCHGDDVLYSIGGGRRLHGDRSVRCKPWASASAEQQSDLRDMSITTTLLQNQLNGDHQRLPRS